MPRVPGRRLVKRFISRLPGRKLRDLSQDVEERAGKFTFDFRWFKRLTMQPIAAGA
jgi:hypothetical protein